MRILAIGDLHGDMETPLRLSERYRPDILLSPGDWGDPGETTPEQWQDLLSSTKVVTATGNHDDLDFLAGLTNADDSPVLARSGDILKVFGLPLAAINGIWAKSHRKPYYVTDEDVETVVADIGGPVDLLLTHGCPLGVCDLTLSNRHGGQRCFLTAFQRLRPRLYICGHLHRQQEHRTKDGALILNTGDGRLGLHFLLEWQEKADLWEIV